MTHWHSFSIQEIFSKVHSSKNGLSSVEAEQRLKEFGLNVLPTEPSLSSLRIFARQFGNPLIYLLGLAVVISFAIGHVHDAVFVLAVLAINIIVSYYPESKADRSFRALKKMVTINARVLRDGKKQEISSEKLVPGDIIILQPGDKIPADCRILESRDIRISEASLTGETRAVEKDVKKLPEITPLTERRNMVYMGTNVEDGWATAIIVATDASTEFGRIVLMLRNIHEPKTPLQKRISTFSKFIAGIIVLIIGMLAVIGSLSGNSFAEIFVTSLALAVSAIPHGLIPAITIILALGSRRILKKNGLVKKLNANETLGSTTVICTDKTGTLTEGNMRVDRIIASSLEDEKLALRIAVLANDAYVEKSEGENVDKWVLRGRPVDKGLLLAGLKANLRKENLEKEFLPLEFLHFSPHYKYAATLNGIGKNRGILHVIGAPEELLSRSKNTSDEVKEKLKKLTEDGLYVIACAVREFENIPKYKNAHEIVENLRIVGLIALTDPLRPGIANAINSAKNAGIRTVVITGDHRKTAESVGMEIGLDVNSSSVFDGASIEAMTDADLRQHVRNAVIFARVLPAHKSRIVEALQANGEIVAMIGDGVNDAPALKSADIGVAVGSGTDVVKEVADLVLLDDSFETVVRAVEQGRVIFNNIRKVAMYLVSVDIQQVFLFFVALFMRWPLPFLPAQVLWINIVEAGLPDTALALENESEGVMNEKPRDPKEAILSSKMNKWMLGIFAVNGIAAVSVFSFVWLSVGDIDLARTLVFVLIAIDSLLLANSVRSFNKSILRRDTFSNKYLVGATVISFCMLIAAIYVPQLQKLLTTQPLSIAQWLALLSISGAEMLLLDRFKVYVFNQKNI